MSDTNSWQKALYMGLPVLVKFGKDGHFSYQEAVELKGVFSSLIGTVLPFNGWFYVYEESYWKALWAWLTDEEWG